jgi:iron complex outermembrane receptor protein
MAKRRFILPVVFASLASAGAAGAQETYKQTVVVTAAATPIELGTANRALTVITREQIDALPAYSLPDVLRLVSSVDVRARGERGVQTDFAVRGATFGQMLVLVDGVRLNDQQSGHHNGDIPVPLDAVERIEVLQGPGASVFGADAYGGAVNIITRRQAPPSAAITAGSNGLAAGRGQWSGRSGSVGQMLSASVDRSGGFMYDRDFRTASIRSQTAWGSRTRVGVSWLDKEFGANNFYGLAPSREWTNQTLLTLNQQLGQVRGWSGAVAASYRTHGDRFLFDQRTPGLFENQHRTHTVLGTFSATRRLARGGSFTAGAEGGQDWIRSTNLGDHELGRVSAFGEWRQPVSRSVHLDASLRADRYEQFGSAWSPSVGAGWWASGRVRLRASLARAFRVPTFTERFYSDPANLARPEVGPERSWSGEGGAEVFLPHDVVVHATVFRRADSDVIDWLRPDTTVRWQTYNVRDVDTVGVELQVSRPLPRGGLITAGYTGLDVSAPAVTQLSKYALDYAPRSFTGAVVLPRFGPVRVAPRLEYRDRRRPRVQPNGAVAVSSADYLLMDARVSVRLTPQLELQVDGTNLFDATYEEVAGVAMPGAKAAVALVVGTR